MDESPPCPRSWDSSEGSGAVPLAQAAEGPARHQEKMRASPVLSPKSTLYLSKFAVLHIEDPILHRSLHVPSAALAASATIRDSRYQQRRKCD